MRITATLLLFTLAIAACKNETAPKAPAADASAILKHKYWVAKPYSDALFAPTVMDTLGYLNCAEILFGANDTLTMTACMSDAGRGVYKTTGVNTIEFKIEGSEDVYTARLDEATGILHLNVPGEMGSYWPNEYVAHDDVNATNIDAVTLNLGRKRLSGQYENLAKTGQMIEFRPDGAINGLGDYAAYEPWIAGIGSTTIAEPPMNQLLLIKKTEGVEPVVLGWQLRNDTLTLWETQNMAHPDDLPEYKTVKKAGTYVKRK